MIYVYTNVTHTCHSVLFYSLPYSPRQVVSLIPELDVLSPSLTGGSENPRNLISVPTSPNLELQENVYT